MIGGLHSEMGDSIRAESELLRCLKRAEAWDMPRAAGFAHSSLTRHYLNHGRWHDAAPNLRQVISMRMRSGHQDDLSFRLSDLGRIQLETDSPTVALASFRQALLIATELGNLRSRIGALEGLSSAYRKLDRPDSALFYLDRCLSSKDSLERSDKRVEATRWLERKKFITLQLTDSLTHALELKSTEVRKQKLIRNASFGGLAFVALFAGIFLFQRIRIGKEKKRSDELLLNILPSEVAEELKANGEAKAKEFAEVTILFTDFKGFTGISEKLSASELVAELNTCFRTFDNIITAKSIEKIKTIGDAYMAAGGLPVPANVRRRTWYWPGWRCRRS